MLRVFFVCEGDNNEFVSSFLSFVFKTIIFGEANKINTKYDLYIFFLEDISEIQIVCHLSKVSGHCNIRDLENR